MSEFVQCYCGQRTTFKAEEQRVLCLGCGRQYGRVTMATTFGDLVKAAIDRPTLNLQLSVVCVRPEEVGAPPELPSIVLLHLRLLDAERVHFESMSAIDVPSAPPSSPPLPSDPSVH